jgi:hypothetical protein
VNVTAKQLSAQLEAIFRAWGMSGQAIEACVRLMLAAQVRSIAKGCGAAVLI